MNRKKVFRKSFDAENPCIPFSTNCIIWFKAIAKLNCASK